ncbi:MAG TPA: hypothetical protein VJ775_06005 [Sphingomicrobium sp.]|nr:hypothetical protein [Sphingomicrobium sp.]
MTDDPGVPLSYYLANHGVGVRFCCEACQASHDVPMADVVERLKALGLGDERTGIREVARFAEKPCPRCGATRWSTRPAWVLT